MIRGTSVVVLLMLAPPALGVEGIITYTGPIPKGPLVVESNTVRQLVEVDAKTRGLKDAFVWLDGVKAPEGFLKEKRKKVVMDQTNYFFKPHALSLSAGTEVEFRNSDVANHCVQAESIKADNTFNIVTPPGDSYKHTFVADNRRGIKIGCPIHSGMRAWIKVYDHPYHAVTDASGAFRLPPVPPGKYRLEVRHFEGGMQKTLPVEVKEGTPLKLEIKFTRDDLKVD